MDFSQDGAHPQVDRRVKKLLRHHFAVTWVISHYFTTAWPPCQISPPSAFGQIFSEGQYQPSKSSICVPDLKDSIRSRILDIPADSFRSTSENMIPRLQNIVDYDRGHIEKF